MRPKIAHFLFFTMQNRGNKHKGANGGQSGISPDHRSERCRSTVMRQINLVWHQQSVRGLLATGEREQDGRGRHRESFRALSLPYSSLLPAARSTVRPSDREGRRSLCGCSPCSVSSVRRGRRRSHTSCSRARIRVGSRLHFALYSQRKHNLKWSVN